MKPETHLISGLIIGGALSLTEPAVNAALICGAALLGAAFPDVPILAQVKADDRAGRKRFSTEKEGTVWFTLKEISHSPLVWIVGLALAFVPMPHLLHLMILALSLGVLSHWVIDMFTHCGAEFSDTDQSLIYPFYYLFPGRSRPGHIPKLGYLVGKTGLGWEYRYNYKDPAQYQNLEKTKLPELAFQMALTLVWLVIMLIRFVMYLAASP